MKIFNREIKLAGTKQGTLRVLARDFQNKIILCSGTSVPTGAGYAKGCLFMKTDVAAGTKGLYENQGDTTTASFNVIGDIATAEIADSAITVAKLATDSVETVKIKDLNVTTGKIAANAVTLAKLAAGIAASHIVKFFVLGSTITTTALAGLAVDDLIVSILADGTVTVATCAVADTLPADPADTTYLIVFRAVA
ncbi:MAG: hypothetical protein PHO75_02430 [Candidatus Shapirobacteria bacterium]|nr:hypothetical protein [Candidatus Shapirobacteria bacterium]